TYCPPAAPGRRVASSAQINAPHIASNPPNTHTLRINNGVCTRCATSEGLAKIPAPTMPPITIIVASNNPSRRRGSLGVVIPSEVKFCRASVQDGRPFTEWSRGGVSDIGGQLVRASEREPMSQTPYRKRRLSLDMTIERRRVFSSQRTVQLVNPKFG